MFLTRRTHLLGVMPFIGMALCQTPPGFSPEVDTSLNVSYSGVDLTQSGELLAMSAVSSSPNISVDANVTQDGNSAGLIIMMDLDMSSPNATSNSKFTTFLNWLATDVNLTTNPITIPDNQGAPYYPPSPPANSSAHRYIFLLFEQPANFSFPPSYQRISPPLTTSSRLGFDLASFAIASGLNVPIAADWMTVRNGAKSVTGNSTSSPNPTSMSNTSGTSSSAPVPKTSSAAGIVSVSSIFSIVAGLFALLA